MHRSARRDASHAPRLASGRPRPARGPGAPKRLTRLRAPRRCSIEERSLAELVEFVHAIDADDRLVRFNDEWAAFARRNGAPTLPETAIGTVLWSHVGGAEVRHIYRAIVDRVRRTGRRAVLSYRCDSPAQRRFLEMSVVAQAEDVEFRSRLLRTQDRAPIELKLVDDEGAPLVVMCAWCKRVLVRDRYVELEDAIRAHGDLDALAARRISHGICTQCKNSFDAGSP